MRVNTARLILSALLTQPEKTAIHDGSRAFARRDVLREVRRRAEAFLKGGVKPGDRVIVVSDRGAPFWMDVLALWVVGGVAVCIEATAQADHAENAVSLTEPIGACLAGAPANEVFDALPRLDGATTPGEDAADSRTVFYGMPWVADADLPDIALLTFTSGTTGLPKGVPLGHGVMIANIQGTAGRVGLKPSDRVMTATSYRFFSTISHFLVTMLTGGTFVGIEEKLMGRDFIDALREHGITAFGGSPFHLRMISYADQTQLPALRWMMSSGDHLPVEVIDALLEGFPEAELHTVYGMVELAGRFCSLTPEGLTESRGSVGEPIPGLEVVVLDEDGAPCPPGEIGHIHARGAISFAGYYRNEAATDAVLGPAGFRTGDMGRFDEHGRLYLAGRSDSVFKRSGVKVSALPITDALEQLDFVAEAFAIGEADPTEGHSPTAYLVLSENADAAGMKKGVVIRALRPLVPQNHLPKKVVLVPSIPRTGSGKVDRRALKELAANDGAAL